MHTALWITALLACSGTEDPDSAETGDPQATDTDTDTSPVDITDALLTLRSENCADYADSYLANVEDIQRAQPFTATLDITVSGSSCAFSSNAIPNHDFNASPASFATPVAEVSQTFQIPSSPVAASTATPLSLQYDNAVFLNGVKLDLLAAACYGVGNEPLGQERIGCFDVASPWRYDPMSPSASFGTDGHNAHTQPDGTYHYHGDPHALFDVTDLSAESPVIGFAADGFPIFGSIINDGGTLRPVKSGYALKSGARVSQSGEGAFPGGTYDGTYRDDYEWTDAGDLDACNGMTHNGVYGYYITDSYPWVLGCFTGTPDASFKKGPP